MNGYKFSLITGILLGILSYPVMAAESYVKIPEVKAYQEYNNTSGKVVASYFPDWRLEHNVYTVRNVPAKNLTHIIYAFLSMCAPHSYVSERTKANIVKACEGKQAFSAIVVDQNAALNVKFDENPPKQEYYGHFGELKKLYEQNPQLVILPSFGGWTMSEPFHALAKSEQGRKVFVKTAVELIAKYDFFGGIDIDWEFPGGEDMSHVGWRDTSLTDAEKANEREVFTLLMKELRAELDALEKKTGRQYELAAAVNGSASKIAAIDWQEAQQYLDRVFAMTYDFFGGWGPQVGHLTNLHATKDTLWGMGAANMLKALETAGVAKEKLVMGSAFYGRGWESAKWEDAAQFPERGSEGKVHSKGSDSAEPGYFSYQDIISQYKDKQGYQYGYDQEAQAPYVYNKQTGGFISFDDERSIKAKSKYVIDQGYGGIFSWEITQDDGALVPAMHEGLGNKPR